jgi:hypothetical protein
VSCTWLVPTTGKSVMKRQSRWLHAVEWREEKLITVVLRVFMIFLKWWWDPGALILIIKITNIKENYLFLLIGKVVRLIHVYVRKIRPYNSQDGAQKKNHVQSKEYHQVSVPHILYCWVTSDLIDSDFHTFLLCGENLCEKKFIGFSVIKKS